ncbi:Peroxiredoxin [Spirosomataceae bacterium TFI 002]|nr:Peroxiredoxin [Spirosomataceae bacterium TFI 002]
MKNIITLSLSVTIVALGTYWFKANDDVAGKLSQPIETNEYQLGDKVADFNLRNVDGKLVSLSDYSSAKGFIVVFTCNHCPFSKAYEDRVIALNNTFASKGYPVIAINPNDPAAYEEDSYENMQTRANEKGYKFPYLEDTQGVGQRFGAKRTPHVFILQKTGGANILRYIGTIDDSAQDAAGVTKKYVEDAVNNLLNDKPVVTQTTRAIGCAIKWRS